VIILEPVGVEDEVLIVKVLEKVGLLDGGLKLHEVPAGSPLVQDKLTDCVEPLNKVAVIVFEPDKP
jgi:hypothetical protein